LKSHHNSALQTQNPATLSSSFPLLHLPTR